MAYRRRHGITRSSTFKEEIYDSNDNSLSPSSSLAAQAIRASAAHRDSSFSSDLPRLKEKSFAAYEDASSKTDPKSGFWGVLARKAKAILEDDGTAPQHYDTPGKMTYQSFHCSTGEQPHLSTESFRKADNPTIRKGLDAITSSLNQLGDTFEKAFEEGRTKLENKTAEIIQETRKLQIKGKSSKSEAPQQATYANSLRQQPAVQPAQPIQANQETQLKASRDVAMATAAKAKLLLRELKTVKADLAFAKERCAQLEEENKLLRENREKGDNRADDDLIRLQLETLLAEKARLARENSIYARENRFLREIVEYHQLTMQDVVYLDEGMEEVTEVYPISSPGVSKILSISSHSPTSPTSPPESSPPESPPATEKTFPDSNRAEGGKDHTESKVPPTDGSSVAEDGSPPVASS